MWAKYSHFEVIAKTQLFQKGLAVAFTYQCCMKSKLVKGVGKIKKKMNPAKVKCTRIKVGLQRLKANVCILEIQFILLTPICLIKSSEIFDNCNSSKFATRVKRRKIQPIQKVIREDIAFNLIFF